MANFDNHIVWPYDQGNRYESAQPGDQVRILDEALNLGPQCTVYSEKIGTLVEVGLRGTYLGIKNTCKGLKAEILIEGRQDLKHLEKWVESVESVESKPTLKNGLKKQVSLKLVRKILKSA